MSDFFQDSFAGTDGTLLSTHTANLGGTYDNAGGGDPFIDGSNRVRANGSAAGVTRIVTTPPSADYAIEVDVTILSALATDQNWHIIIRGTSDNLTRYALIYDAVGHGLSSAKTVGGTFTNLHNTPFTPTVGQTYKFRVQGSGTAITFWRDGTQISALDTTDSAITAAGFPGIVVQGANTGSTGLRFANIHVFPTGSPSLPSYTATVAAGGDRVNITFASTISSVAVTDFIITAAGQPLPIGSVTGSGTAYVLILANPYLIGVGQAVNVAYIGTLANTGSVTATNSTSLAALAPQQTYRGFGIFLHWSSATFTSPGFVTQATMNSVFTPTSYNMDQWLNAVQAAGARYAVLTTKHDGGFCLWPTASGAPNIAPTPWYAANHIDIVQDFTTKCRARGLGVGLYINFYDPYYTSLHGGNYTPQATYTAYMVTQITELLSNYGKIDLLWTDSWEYGPGIGYTNAPYATFRNLITSLQPNCLLENNAHTGDISHSDIAIFEGDGVQAEPSGNLLPAEFCENARADIQWVWQASGQNTYKDPAVLSLRLKRLEAQRCNYLLNFPPNNLGLLPASNVTFASTLGAMIGTQGGTVLPIPGNVKLGVDRGDGFIGTFAGSGGGGSGVTCAFSGTGCHMIERFQG